MGEFSVSRIFCKEQPNLHQVGTPPPPSPQTCIYRIKAPLNHHLSVINLEHDSNSLLALHRTGPSVFTLLLKENVFSLQWTSG